MRLARRVLLAAATIWCMASCSGREDSTSTGPTGLIASLQPAPKQGFVQVAVHSESETIVPARVFARDGFSVRLVWPESEAILWVVSTDIGYVAYDLRKFPTVIELTCLSDPSSRTLEASRPSSVPACR